MRIFCAVRHARDQRKFYGGLWSANFYPALRELGHEIVESQVDLLPNSRFMQVPSDFTAQEREVRTRTTEQILAEVRATHKAAPVDLFLSYFYNAHFDPAGFDELRQLGIPSVNFFCNSIHQFECVAAIAAQADFSWHAERDACGFYRAVGGTPVWVQMAADPQVYHPIPGVVRQPRACFVGQRYADRARWMAAIVQAGVPVDIYGPGWDASSYGMGFPVPAAYDESYLGRKFFRPGSLPSYAMTIRRAFTREGPVRGLRRISRQWFYRHEDRQVTPLFAPHAKGAIPFEKIAEVFAKFDLCLNFSNVWSDGQPGSQLIPHVRLRDFEGPMSRTCYLTGYTAEIAEFYKVGQEIETYRTPSELVEKARFYLAHPEAAEKLREAGYRRALRDHTWKRRFEELFSKIGREFVRT